MAQKVYKYRWDRILLSSIPVINVDRLIQERPYKVLGEVAGSNDNWKWQIKDEHAEHLGYETEQSAINGLLGALKINPDQINPSH